MANINPYRYRGYYYDTETGLYFLKARYYDPTVGRFISMDDVAYIDPETIGGLNLFAYCNNNPVMYVDPTGTSFLGVAAIITAGVLIIGGGALGGISAAASGGSFSDIWEGIGKGMLAGAILYAGLALTVGSFYVPGGVFGTVGSFMFSFGSGMLLDIASVSIAQSRKSIMDGDDFWSSTKDVFDSIYSNSANVVLGKKDILGLKVIGANAVDLVGMGYGVLPVIYEMFQCYGLRKSVSLGFSEYFAEKQAFGESVFAFLDLATNIYSFVKEIFSDPKETGWILH